MDKPEVERYIAKNKLKVDVKYYTGVIASLITIVIFLNVLFGAIQLFLFSNQYQVAFNGLSDSRVFITFSVAYLLVFSLITTPILMLGWLAYVFFDDVYAILIEKSRSKKVRGGGFWFYLVCLFFVAGWALVFMLSPGVVHYGLVGYFLGCSVLLFYYINVWTVLPGKKWSERVSSYTLPFMGFGYLMLFGMSVFYLILMLEFKHLKDIKTHVAMPVVFICLLIVMFTSTGMAYHRRKTGVFPKKLVISCITLLYLLSIPLSNYASDLAMKASGMGFYTLCIPTMSLTGVYIPEDAKKTEGEFTRLNIVTKANGVFYVASSKDAYSSAIYSFHDDDYPKGKCPLPIGKDNVRH